MTKFRASAAFGELSESDQLRVDLGMVALRASLKTDAEIEESPLVEVDIVNADVLMTRLSLAVFTLVLASALAVALVAYLR